MGAVRQKIDALFDYRGDNLKNAGNAGPRMYSSDYSPNNIRRVVISPNGVFVVYHRSVNGTKGRNYNYIEFKEQDLYVEEQERSYKPILRNLAVPLVCASVEEIIVLRRSLSGQIHPNYMNEIKLETMVASFKGEGADLKTRIGNRFKRLRYYTVLDINFKEFLNFFRMSYQSGDIKKYSFFTEMPALRARATTTELAGSDYWKYNGCQPSHYTLDGALQEHFNTIAQKRDAAVRAQQISETRDKRVGNKIQAINDLIDDFLVYSKLWASFYSIVQKEGTNGVLSDLSFVQAAEVVQLLPFKGMKKVDDRFVSKQPCSEAEAFEKDEAMLRNYKVKCCKALASCFLTGLDGVRSRGELVLLKTICDGCETVICVPPELNGVVQQIEAATGVLFGGRAVDTSIVNSCAQFMRYFVGCERIEPFNREYWQNKIKKGVA